MFKDILKTWFRKYQILKKTVFQIHFFFFFFQILSENSFQFLFPKNCQINEQEKKEENDSSRKGGAYWSVSFEDPQKNIG